MSAKIRIRHPKGPYEIQLVIPSKRGGGLYIVSLAEVDGTFSTYATAEAYVAKDKLLSKLELIRNG